MRKVLSVRSAAELASVGEPAIRRAVREQRLVAPLIFYVGERHTTWIDLDSLAAVYELTDEAVERYYAWLDHLETEPPVVATSDGTQWCLIDRGPVFHVVS